MATLRNERARRSTRIAINTIDDMIKARRADHPLPEMIKYKNPLASAASADHFFIGRDNASPVLRDSRKRTVKKIKPVARPICNPEIARRWASPESRNAFCASGVMASRLPVTIAATMAPPSLGAARRMRKKSAERSRSICKRIAFWIDADVAPKPSPSSPCARIVGVPTKKPTPPIL